MRIQLTANLGYVQRECHYKCPVTGQLVTSNRQRRRIMEERNFVDANDFPPEKAFAKAEKEKARDLELIAQLKKDYPKDVDLNGLLPSAPGASA